MAIQLTWFNPGSGVGGYPVSVLGDGSSTSVSVDFFEQIEVDKAIRNKVPTGIWMVASSISPSPSASLSGTTVTFTWPVAPAANSLISLGVYLTFNP